VVNPSALPTRSDPAPYAGAVAAAARTPSPVGASTTAALRCWIQALQRAHAAGRGVDSAEVRRTMRRLAEAARPRGARVEQLIVLLKQLWGTLPAGEDWGGHRTAHGVDGRGVLDGLIRVCIEEFYAPAHAPAGPPAPDGRRAGGESPELGTPPPTRVAA
jgi:hypothetical protein